MKFWKITILNVGSISNHPTLGVLSEHERGTSEGESKDPEEVSRSMVILGILSMQSCENALTLHSHSKHSRDPSTRSGSPGLQVADCPRFRTGE
jgi:hypothetical protein